MSDSRTPGRHSACDRCRTQKLRCLRVGDGHTTDSCVRCIQSRVECVTSSSKRPGRPTRNPGNASRQNTNPTPKTRNETNVSLHAMDDLALANVDDRFKLGSLDANYEIPSAGWTPVDSGDVYYHDFPMAADVTAFDISSLSGPTNGSSYPASLNGLTGTTLSDQSPSVQSEHGHDAILQLFDHQPSAQNYDHGLRLSVLYHDLSKQLFMLRSMPCDMAEVMRLTCIHDTTTDDSADKSKPLASIVKRSAEFAELLSSFQTPTKASNGNNDTTTNEGGPLPRLSIANLLTTLSCHILIISIYNSIFGHFMDLHLHQPGAIDKMVQSGPKLCLGGVEVPTCPNVLGHLLFCLTESQLRPIELLLGLPDEFCVTLNKNSVSKNKQNGLFGSPSGQSLFTALMQVETERTAEERGGLGVIESLKEQTRRLQGLR